MALETQEWLVWLGVKEPQVSLSEIKSDIDRLKDSVGTWEDFQDIVSNSADYTELENNLVNAGFPSDKVDAFISKLQDQFDSYSDFQSTVSGLTSYLEFQSQFGNQSGMTGDSLTEDGEPVAGIRVHDSSGTSYAGVSVPEGTTEVFGRRIEFSQQDPSVDPDEVSYSNFSTDDADDVTTVSTSMEFSADVTNPNAFGVDVTIPFIEDGTVLTQKNIRLGANATQTVSFSVTKTSSECHDYRIGDSGTILACWAPAGLQVT